MIVRLLSSSGTHVAHCPTSNAKVSSVARLVRTHEGLDNLTKGSLRPESAGCQISKTLESILA